MTKPDDPAFLQPWFSTKVEGLTKREYFAAMAMQGLANAFIAHSSAFLEKEHLQNKIDDMAKQSTQIADALIAELSKEGK